MEVPLNVDTPQVNKVELQQPLIAPNFVQPQPVYHQSPMQDIKYSSMLVKLLKA